VFLALAARARLLPCVDGSNSSFVGDSLKQGYGVWIGDLRDPFTRAIITGWTSPIRLRLLLKRTLAIGYSRVISFMLTAVASTNTVLKIEKPRKRQFIAISDLSRYDNSKPFD